MRLVLDTNVLYAGIRSARGASRILLELVETGVIELALTPALFLESEEQLQGDTALHALGLTDIELNAFLDELAAKSHLVRIDIRWRPVSPDPDDVMVIEAAANGNAVGIVTFNTRDFLRAQALFRLALFTPKGFLIRFGRR